MIWWGAGGHDTYSEDDLVGEGWLEGQESRRPLTSFRDGTVKR